VEGITTVSGKRNTRTVSETIFVILILLLVTLAPLAQALKNLDDEKVSIFDTGNRRNTEPLKAGDPVAASNGAYEFTLPLFDLGGPMDLHFSLIYRSDLSNWMGDDDFPDWRYSPFWWSPNCVARLWTVPGPNQFWLEDFRMVAFNGTTGEIDESQEAQPVRYVMNKNDEYVYLMDPLRERVYIFNTGGTVLLRYIMDRNGNTLSYNYEYDVNSTSWHIINITDGLGREISFTHSVLNGIIGDDVVLTKVTDWTGREILLNYEESALDNEYEPALRSVTDADGNTITFNYTIVFPYPVYIDQITKITWPAGNAPYTQNYTFTNLSGIWSSRVDKQTDAYGNQLTLSYDSTQNQVNTTWPDASEIVYQHYGHHQPPKSLTDTTDKTINFTKNERDQVTSVTDRLGDTTTFTYHPPTGKLAAITNNKGDTINYTYAAQNQNFTNPQNGESFNFTFYNLVYIDYPNTAETFTYDAHGNMLTYTDRAGKTWQNTYNTRGQVTQITNPTGGVIDYTYNADATLNNSTDSDLGTTTYGYDAYKRLNRITYPDATFIQIAYDLNDRVTSITDERDKSYNYTYDANGNLVNATDPAGNETQYAYDLMDRVVQRTNRRDKTETYTYDTMNRLASITDANGNSYQLAYDPRGWLNQIIDPAGMVWQLTYDDEGLMNAMTTPLGHTTTYTRDKLGYVTGITNPLGHTITFTRDNMSRITAATDPLGRTTTYTYEQRGILASVTRPDIGTANFAYTDLGLLATISDLNGKDWKFTYTPMGRLQKLTDPLGNAWLYAYNERGYLDRTTYPTGETQNRIYDAAGNLVRREYSDGTDLQFSYDALNRLSTANGLNLTYNEIGRVTSTENPPDAFCATYDDAGRIETVTYADGLFTVTYQYDSRGLLTQVTDSRTGTTISFTYDDDGRVTGITRSNGVDSTFTWDDAMRLTRMQHNAVADLQYQYNAAGEVTQLDYTLPLDPADYLAADTKEFTYDDASQISYAGYSYDTRGRQTASPTETFTWDGASRLTGTGTATLEYNGLGDLIKRTAGGTTTHYYYNYGIDLNPVVAEKDEGTSEWRRFYVLAPSGHLLYMIDASDSDKVYFYHYDRTGNTLFLTDAEGTVTDSYAYTPYGKLLDHEGTNEQPFTFGGSYQARAEGNDLYQMRARYYDAETGRFISREPLWPMIANGKSINPYQYAFQNPMLYVDRTGLEPIVVPRVIVLFSERDKESKDSIREKVELEVWSKIVGRNVVISTPRYRRIDEELWDWYAGIQRTDTQFIRETWKQKPPNKAIVGNEYNYIPPVPSGLGVSQTPPEDVASDYRLNVPSVGIKFNVGQREATNKFKPGEVLVSSPAGDIWEGTQGVLPSAEERIAQSWRFIHGGSVFRPGKGNVYPPIISK
jgi:RHS repeat-associated protein